MIPRYAREAMVKVWEPENRFNKWLQIETLVCEALNQMGEIPDSALQSIKRKASFTLERIEEIEREVKHDVIAFLTCISEQIGEDARYIHMGLTSSDILDTAFALQLKEASTIIIQDIERLLEVLKEKAFLHKKTVMMGRTHGVHAEPITFGFKMALWYEEMKRNLSRMKRVRDVISYGKISGAVGTYAHLAPQVEEFVCKRLGLKPEPISTQIIQRDRHAEFFAVLAIIASCIDTFAQEIRLLQRTEVREAEEYFAQGQKGSSAMPHKRNPILSENLSGLARLVRSYALAALENIPLWHERDISHSSVERVIGPDSTIVVDFMLNRFISLVKQLKVYPRQMERNLNITRGIFYSQSLLIALVKKGMSREEAYRIVQGNAYRALEEEGDFLEIMKNDIAVRKYLTSREIDQCCSLKHYLRYIDDIFLRVFGHSSQG